MRIGTAFKRSPTPHAPAGKYMQFSIVHTLSSRSHGVSDLGTCHAFLALCHCRGTQRRLGLIWPLRTQVWASLFCLPFERVRAHASTISTGALAVSRACRPRWWRRIRLARARRRCHAPPVAFASGHSQIICLQSQSQSQFIKGRRIHVKTRNIQCQLYAYPKSNLARLL